MASIDDLWYIEHTQPNGSTKRVKTARHGRGKRWLLRWRDDDNEPHKKSFARRGDADRAKIEIEADLARGVYRDPDAGKVSFRTYAERWRSSLSVEPNTAAGVEALLRRHVYPAIGSIALGRITPSTIRDLVGSFSVARSYQDVIYRYVSQILTAAVADDIITKNPCDSPTVRRPRPDHHKVVPWSHEWLAGVCDALPDRYRIVALLGAGAGLRQGEILGLSPADIDFDNATIDVRRQVKLALGARPYLGLPKGRKTRTIPLPASLARALSTYLEQFPARAVTLPWDLPDGDPITEELVLTTSFHNAVNRNYFNRAVWKPALAAAGIPTTPANGCHALRHFYASVLLHGGESIKVVSERLGHADPAFTLRTYTHLMPDSSNRTRTVIDSALDRLGARTLSSRATDVPQTGR